ncbi:MAG: OmpA family protein [Hyphomicrobiaceae bacterium]
MGETSARTVGTIIAALFAAIGTSYAVTGGLPGTSKAPNVAAGMGLPSWSISDICASDSAGGQCRILEAEAQRTLSGGWDVVPSEFRDACIGQLKGPYDRSYRLLSQCLEEQVSLGRAKKEGIKTAAKGGEAVPSGPATMGSGFALLPTASTADLIKAREAWGAGPAARTVEAPLAKGAVVPLPADAGRKIVAPAGETIVHPLVATPAAQLAAIPEGQIVDGLKALLAQRAGWGTAPSSGDATSAGAIVVAGLPALPTSSTGDLIAARETWGAGKSVAAAKPHLAAGAQYPLPADAGRKIVAPAGETIVHPLVATPAAQLAAIPEGQIVDGLKALLAQRAGWGTAPSSGDATSAGAIVVAGLPGLPTSSTGDLIAARETWGAGKAVAVARPTLAKGAQWPLPADAGRKIVVPKGETIVHELVSTPVAQLTAVPEAKISDALKALLAERSSWGLEPSRTIGYPYLPTSSTAELVAAREAWGDGPKPRVIAAPLAKGAVSPLPKETSRRTEGPPGDPIIRPLEATPVAQVAPIPEGQIANALKALLAEREGWLKAPTKRADEPRAPAGGGASLMVAGRPALPVSSTGDLIAARETWGMAKATAGGRPPMAAGAQWPLPPDAGRKIVAPAGETIVHPLVATPVAKMAALGEGQIADALKKLLAERASWGAAPSSGGAPAKPTGEGRMVAGLPALPVSSTGDLIAARETWGMAKATGGGRPPLAAGAKWPLPPDAGRKIAAPKGETIVHPLVATPAAQLTAIPQGQISDALKALLAERASWGTTPSKGGAKVAAAPRSAEAVSCEGNLRKAMSEGVILFETNSARIARASNVTLDSLAKVAKGCAKGRIRVDGHTDSVGRAAYNKRLSELRARAVADYLVKAGVKKSRVDAQGFGAENPVASNDTAEGRAQNRRIEFTVTE